MKVKGRRNCWQLVHTFAGFHARYVAGNSEVVAWTEVYPEERTAEHAVLILGGRTFHRVDEREGKITPRPELPKP